MRETSREALGEDPCPTEEWEVWYRDTFDRETPPQAEARGRGLVRGLAELWARHLCEGVQADGEPGFSRFHLRWSRGRVDIADDREGAASLRRWLFGGRSQGEDGPFAAADSELLGAVARAHARLLDRGQAVQPILTLAALAGDGEELGRRLAELGHR